MAEQTENQQQPPQLSIRDTLVLSCLGDDERIKLEEHLLKSADLDVAVTKVDDETIASRITLIRGFAECARGDEAIVAALAADSSLSSLRQVAARFNAAELSALVDRGPGVATASTSEAPQDVSAIKPAARIFRQRIFVLERDAVLRKMVDDGEIPIGLRDDDNDEEDANVKRHIIDVLHTHPDLFSKVPFSLTEGALKDISEENGTRQKVDTTIRAIQRVQSLSTAPAAVAAMLKAGFGSAQQIAAVPASHFVHDIGNVITADDTAQGSAEEAARNIHAQATNVALHANMALASTLQMVRGTGVRAIDGAASRGDRIAAAESVTVSGMRSTVNLEQLFGTMDFCECSDCASVTSPAAYLVDILQFLRNNNLKDEYRPGWEGTALEMLFRRRPDLAEIELTCANTNTVLPYIDLSNEVMESFVCHLGKFIEDNHQPKQVTLDAFNIDEDDVSSALLSQPANVNYAAYCKLKDAVYPFTLPYHQPLDEIRILLGHLGTSRHELLNIFRPTQRTGDPRRDEWGRQAHERAYVAEYLLLSQQDFRVLTRQVFYPKEYFEYIISPGTRISDEEYEARIQVEPAYRCWGYVNGDHEMLSTVEEHELGLAFVKKQFLPRSGIKYTDLVDLLRTTYINPNYPSGWALLLLHRLRWSYRYLVTLLGPIGSTGRYDKLIAFLIRFQPLAELFGKLRQKYIDDLGRADQGKNAEALEELAKRRGYPPCSCDDGAIWRCWVLRYFDLVGDLIVLDSRDGGVFETEGWLVLQRQVPQLGFVGSAAEVISGRDDNVDRDIGYLHRDGRITSTAVDGTLTLVGRIDETGAAVDVDGVFFHIKYGLDWQLRMQLWNIERTRAFGEIDNQSSNVYVWNWERAASWGPIQDTCNIENVRLIRLNGEALRIDDCDRIHRFIRLWRRLDWSIDDLDQALLGLATVPESSSDGGGSDTPSSNPGRTITWEDFHDRCQGSGNGGGGDRGQCPLHEGEDWTPPALASISPGFLGQVVALKKLLDLTGLGLAELLTFWADISVHGQPKSLYAKLFLTHNLLGIDRVFAADANGNYLNYARPEKLAAHAAVVMAALRIRTADDLRTATNLAGLPQDADLTLKSVSSIYRLVLLARVLSVKLSLLPSVITLLGDPFGGGAVRTISFLEDWDRISSSGFSLHQLVYVIEDDEIEPVRPVGPSITDILKTTKQLADGLDAILKTYPDIDQTDPTAVPSTAVTAAASQAFDATTVSTLAGVIEGSWVWQTNAPVGMAISVPALLKKKFSYSSRSGDASNAPSATVQMTGILTASEAEDAKFLGRMNPLWAPAIDRLMRKPGAWFNDTLRAVFSANLEEAKATLLAGDVPPTTPDPTQDESVPVPDPGSAPSKRLYFLVSFLPFLRDRLSDKMVSDVMMSVSGLSPELTHLLLDSILRSGTTSALEILRNLKSTSSNPSADWTGYLIPPTNDEFVFFSIADTQPSAIILDGASVSFPQPLDDPSNVWVSEPVKLTAGRLYSLTVPGRPATQLQWKSARSPRAGIPASALLSGHATQIVTDVFSKLVKAGIVVNIFSLTTAEIIFLTDAEAHFDGFDLNSLSLRAWRRLCQFSSFRNGLAAPEAPLIALFKWASLPSAGVNGLVDKIIASTRWDSQRDSLTALLASDHFDLLSPANFLDERALIRLQKALALVKSLGVVDVPMVFSWADPLVKFWVARIIADNIRKVVRARYTTTDWEAAVQPLYNTLRENQKNALIAYLLAQQVIRDQGIADADGLFEFFLIDVQMSSCLQTSRIKQAISSVQLFIQRCLLGLELQPRINSVEGDRQKVPVRIDAVRWSWMEKYRVWEANRKVFLYPENWLTGELRDDKSPFYRELESELLQKDVDSSTVAAAFRNYLTKVDDVANLEAQGLFLEQTTDVKIVHIVARTRCAPYAYYYRRLDAAHVIWQPWERMTVDIPNYTSETADGVVLENGTYVTPVVWNGRLLVFFPQFAKKTVMPPKAAEKSMVELGDEKPSTNLRSIDYWEIRLCCSERRQGGEWTTKIISSDGVYETVKNYANYSLPNLNGYLFVPRLEAVPDGGGGTKLSVDVLSNVTSESSVAVGSFDFVNGRLLKSSDGSITASLRLDTGTPAFGYWSGRKELHSLQASTATDNPEFYKTPPYVEYPDSVLSTVFDLYARLEDSHLGDAFGDNRESRYHELKKPYAIYNWELGLHAPLAVMDKLVQQRQFDQALDLCHAAIFNPMVNTNDVSKCWQFRPFQEIVAKDYLENFMQSLVPNEENTQYGDFYFRQNTLETLPLAIQMYVRASHVYGPAGQRIPKRGKTEPHTYRRLLERFDAFGNAAVDLELEFPFSNQVTRQFPVGFTGRPDTPVDLPNVFGSATTQYFCIPDNPQLRAVRATIDDRLFKLRHCQDINGKAHEVCGELRQFVAGFLAAKEKQDGEALASLRQRHEVTISELLMGIKKAQVDEASLSLDSLRQTRLGPVYRMRHYLSQLGEDVSKVPTDVKSPFAEIELSQEKLVADTGLRLIPSEKEEQDRSTVSRNVNISVGATEALSTVFLALPSTNVHGTPLGVGAAVKWGFPQLGHGLGAVARGLRAWSDHEAAQASMAGRRTGLLRAMQDRVQMANSAGYEVKAIDSQILTQQVKLALAERDVSNHQQSIDNARETADFLATKYTNAQLYSHLEASSRRLAYEAYTLAYDLARRAERTFHFERPAEISRSYISFGYWDPARDGLLAGEALALSLRRLEAAYQDRRGHDFEVTRSISLRLLAPLELVRLRETARCEFALPETLFDMDFPGHYMRRVRSIALSIPCVVGPHVGVNATLRLLENKMRTSPLAADANAYPETPGDDGLDQRFTTSSVPITAIAASSAQTDPGVFELSMKDERFLPFEGAGVISRWRLTLPSPAGPASLALRPFDYGTITDAAASGAIRSFVQAVEDDSSEAGGGLYTIMDLRAEFATEWYRFAMAASPPDADRTILLRDVASRLPYVARGASKLTASSVSLYSTAEIPATALRLARAGSDADIVPFTEAAKLGRLFAYSASTEGLDISGDWILTLKAHEGADVSLDGARQGMWLVLRYRMQL
ncbi:Protein kinase DC2 [Verticillium dahliae VDG1]|nr:Protein kinase DC2 [Verticillium dahliae VDG1]